MLDWSNRNRENHVDHTCAHRRQRKSLRILLYAETIPEGRGGAGSVVVVGLKEAPCIRHSPNARAGCNSTLTVWVRIKQKTALPALQQLRTHITCPTDSGGTGHRPYGTHLAGCPGVLLVLGHITLDAPTV
jgi:hypothetical protein